MLNEKISLRFRLKKSQKKVINTRNCLHNWRQLIPTMELPRWLSGKESACQCRRLKRHRFKPWVRKIPWRRKWQSTPFFFCLGNPVDRGAWQPIAHGVAKDSDMTEHTRNSHYAFPSADLILCAPAFSTWNVPYLFHLANSFSSF